MSHDNLWSHCKFFGKNFDEQVIYSEKRIGEHFDAWRKTKTANIICKGGKPRSINDLPITEYSDYPILSEVRNLAENETKNKPRREGELWHDYYTRMLESFSKVIEGYLPDRSAICIKTTGTTGTNKFVVHGETFLNQFVSDSVASLLMAASKENGEKILDEKLNVLNLFAPVPYLSGWVLRYWEDILNFVPPISVTDNISDMGKKFYLALQMIQKGSKIHIVGGSGALLYMACKYFSDPQYFFEQSYRSTPSTYKKAFTLFKLAISKLEKRPKSNLKNMMPLKGAIVGSTDARIYAQFLKEEFDIDPFNYYAATEIGCSMLGRLDNKLDLFPNLRGVYMEFLDEKGELKKISELKKNNIYELIATPYFSMFTRYRIRDIFRLIDFSDESPIFSFEGRTQNMIDIYNYYRFSENLMARVMVSAGFGSSDKWVVTKSYRPRELIEIYFEKEWPISENEAQKLIFNSMLTFIPGFDSYVRDFKIMDPTDAIRVQFLEKGTFTRYTIKQVRKNVPLGQYKPLKIIPPEKSDILEELKESSRND